MNTARIGLFGFSAIYHLVLWWQSRRGWIHGLLCKVRDLLDGPR